MQFIRELGRESFGEELKKFLLIGLFVFGFVFIGKAEEPTNSFVEVQKELHNLELQLEKVILNIDTQEKAMLQKHLELCENIEKQFKDAEEKKPGSRISKKQQKKLLAKLEMEYKTINMIKQLNMLSREAKKKEFETQAKVFFDKYDIYLSNQ